MEKNTNLANCCMNCDWYDRTVPTFVVRNGKCEHGFKCSITNRGMFKSDGKKCKHFIQNVRSYELIIKNKKS